MLRLLLLLLDDKAEIPVLSGPHHRHALSSLAAVGSWQLQTFRGPPSQRTKSISTLPRQRDLASPLMRLWRKTCPTPLQSCGLDCHGSSKLRLHSLSSWVSVVFAAPTFRDLIHLRFNESCHFWES